MRLGFRLATGAALAAAMLAGDVATLSLTPAAASAQAHGGGGFHGGGGGGFHGGGGGGYHGGGFGGGYHGGGYGGYHGGYGGYRGGYGGFGFGYGGFGYGGFGGYYGGFGVGDALLGAAVIGGTAAIIASEDRPVYVEPYPVYQTYPPVYAPGYAPPAYAPGYPPADYRAAPPPPEPAYSSRDPVEQCSRAAVSEAASHGDSGRVLSIDRVDGRQNGAQVLGTLEVRRPDRDGSRGSVERARFTCTADYGQVTAFRFG